MALNDLDSEIYKAEEDYEWKQKEAYFAWMRLRRLKRLRRRRAGGGNTAWSKWLEPKGMEAQMARKTEEAKRLVKR